MPTDKPNLYSTQQDTRAARQQDEFRETHSCMYVNT
jgi:hypothetical protein